MNKYFVAGAVEFREHSRKIIEVKKIEIGVFYVEGSFYAWRNMCPHAGAPVCLGQICGTTLPSMVYEYEYGLERCILRCPWHGWEYDLRNGAHLADPNVKLRGYEVLVENNNVYVLMNS